RGQEQRDQHRDDGEHHQQLDQREPGGAASRAAGRVGHGRPPTLPYTAPARSAGQFSAASFARSQSRTGPIRSAGFGCFAAIAFTPGSSAGRLLMPSQTNPWARDGPPPMISSVAVFGSDSASR